MIKEIIIAPNHIKKEILKATSKQKEFSNIKIFTKEEFIKNYYGTYKNEAIYFLMKEKHLEYSSAHYYLKNIFVKSEKIKPYYEILKKENLIEFSSNFKENLKKISVLEYKLDPYLIKELEKYNLNKIGRKTGNLNPPVHEFKTQTEEIIFIAQNIINKIKKQNINISDIFIVQKSEEYQSELIRILNLFKIPFSLKNTPSIYSTQISQTFLNKLKETKNIESALNHTKNGEIKNQIIDILNKFNFEQIDDIAINITENEIKNTKIKPQEKTNTVKIIDLNQVTDQTKHYFIIGINQGIMPNLYKDDEIITDKEKEKIGLLTSLDKNQIEKNKLKHIIKTFPNITLSYKLKDDFQTYFKSFLIDELALEIIQNHETKYNLSADFNKLKLGLLLDDLTRYNKKDKDLKLLLNQPPIPYRTYQNQYKKIDEKYLNIPLTLSYTSLNTYAMCPFKFYVQKILNLNNYEETFQIVIGNLFHNILKNIYNENFNIESEYQTFIKNKTFTPKEKFYLDKLFQTLKKDIEIIKWQETQSTYTNHLTEFPVEIKKTKNITVKGVIDKINYIDKNAIIIDYKTGNAKATLDNINYGLNMQLPTYIYLVKTAKKEMNINGFYLHPLLLPPEIDKETNEKEKLKLNGYTIDKIDIIKNIDQTYQNSQIIQSLKTKDDGFYAYSKVISRENISALAHLAEKNIDEKIKQILNGKFEIKPKRIDQKNLSCDLCTYKDICYVKEKDINDLQTVKFKDILGDDENANVD